ncbi:hypothetical protein HMF7854_03865 [Sphingomonas ginkgonis]|uniref:histidine kinase n=1 Tax=Sphingomonas ginkgonis TaxID=2315330 RepID=A0A3R9WRG9_9SPHN|nr:hypothetical protein [Sphingomonas ginkgonis]RST30058.1 hypothetical protein HMF7854_03865 [Sphingomonas ginkgonis]
MVLVYNNITARKRAEAALRASEERLAILLNLTDALRPLKDPLEILDQSTRILGEYMQADRTFIAMMEPDGVNRDVYHEYLRPGASSVLGHHNFDQFGAFVSPLLREGHIMAVEDVATLSLTEAELSAQAHHEEQYSLDGPDLVLAPKAAEVLTLTVHELTTNAVKYGALSTPHGRVSVRWATFERRGASWFGFDWSEEGAPADALAEAASRKPGFGSELIEGRLPYELGGRGKLTIEPGGARCRLEFPMKHGASMLETTAPRRATVFGGALDMSAEAGLTGHRVLVLEDDFYLASDTRRALEGAGAEVLGPCASEGAAMDEMDDNPTAAVVDVNLGRGPSFELARSLKDRGTPFVFITGYDEEIIPSEFDGIARLQKPVELKDVVRSLSSALGLAS